MSTPQPEVSTHVRHHYLPEFYLRRWAGTDGRLVRFSRPDDTLVKPKRYHPKQVGYVVRLYEMDGVPEDQRQEFERTFLSPVDSRAAEALETMERRQTAGSLNPALRSAWAHFIQSLMTRMPADIAAFKTIAREAPGAYGRQAVAEAARRHGASRAQADAVLRQMVMQGIPELPMRIVRRLISAERTHELLLSLKWTVRALAGSCESLLTGERAIRIGTPLGDFASILLPIGPRLVFGAFGSSDQMIEMAVTPDDVLARALNLRTVSACAEQVFGDSDAHLELVREHLGSCPQPSLFEGARLPSRGGSRS
jgi:hypothetical protein